MTRTNNQLNDICKNFVKKSGAYKTVWNRIIHIAGNSFLTMNDEELKQFFIKEVIYDEMETSTKDQYRGAYKKIVSYLKNNGYINADLRKLKRQTNLVHISRNKDSKMDDIIADKLHEKKSHLKESINSIEQEIKKYEQQINELKEKCSKNRNELANLAKLESIHDEIITVLFS